MAQQMGVASYSAARHQVVFGFIERRASPRMRVFKKGKLIHTNNITVFDCMIRDISDTGARLSCGETATMPREMQLVLHSQREVRMVRVVWRKPRELGVQFLEPPKPLERLLV
jgi:hypothetical protein